MKIIEEPQLAVKRKFPWPVDVLLYPTNMVGMVYIGIFLFLFFAVGVLHKFVFSRGGYLGAAVSVGLYVLWIGYVFYYLAYCVVDSAKGNRRAPDISIRFAPDQNMLVSQLICVLGGIAFCFWPVAVYYVLTERSGPVFWLLLAGGIFFLPMALLRVLMFDCFDALNPFLIVKSILKTFFVYLALVPFFFLPIGVVVLITSGLPQARTVQGTLLYVFLLLNYFSGIMLVLRVMLFIYLAMVGAHLLGCFYWWHKDKLDWGL